MGFHPPAVIGRAVNTLRLQAPPEPRPDARSGRPKNLEAFAVGVDWVQIVWSALGPGSMEIDVVGPERRRVVVDADGGPGSVVVDGLASGARWSATVTGPGIAASTRLSFSTLDRPSGALLAKVATVSDCHLGAPSTGYFHTLREVPEREVEVTSRCLRAALDELDVWGAEMLVVKGDLVDTSTPELWNEAATILATVDIPMMVVPGNHEHAQRGEIDPFAGAAAVGIDLVDHVEHVDLAEGRARVITADVGMTGADRGRLDAVADDIVTAAAEAEDASLIAFHHQAMRLSFPTYIPPGIPGPQARRLSRSLRAHDARTMVTSGHTHRNRRRLSDGITMTEVGSTRDFPGVWAGYEFYEGGVVQTVHRIAEPSCIRWSDFTRRSALGAWSRWASGSLQDRCFTLDWR